MPGGPEGGEQCAGLTSGISKIDHGRHYRVVDGLISLAGKDGTAAEGVVAVAGHHGKLYAQVGLNSRALPADLPSSPVVTAAKRELGRTLAIGRHGRWWPIASTGNKDYDWTADHKDLQPDQFPDANPNGLTVRGRSIYVADAGANLLARVGRKGRVTTVAYFQVPAGSPTDAVPTCVANAPDGSLYVGELLGGTFAPGGARVWQVWPNGKARVKWSGFTGIQGCGFDNHGNFYVTEFQANGMFGPNPRVRSSRSAPTGTARLSAARLCSSPPGSPTTTAVSTSPTGASSRQWDHDRADRSGRVDPGQRPAQSRSEHSAEFDTGRVHHEAESATTKGRPRFSGAALRACAARIGTRPRGPPEVSCARRPRGRRRSARPPAARWG